MCDCLNDIVEVAICVQAGALDDADAPHELDAVAAWASHEHSIDVPMARSAPVHFAVAMINVPRGGNAAAWLVAEFERLLDVAEDCDLHPAWRAYGGVWLAQLAAVAGSHSLAPELAAQALASARRHVDAVDGVCPDALYAPPTVAELEESPYDWLECDGTRSSIPSPGDLIAGLARYQSSAHPDPLTPVVLGLRTTNTDDWRTWPTHWLLTQVAHSDN
ncbi:MAG TPA: hypothetical protein VFE15_03550 [Marmoricola sp.]|jgi:hypothetical protein|nr:hypothetical protein [Marmoricola sp.]